MQLLYRSFDCIVILLSSLLPVLLCVAGVEGENKNICMGGRIWRTNHVIDLFSQTRATPEQFFLLLVRYIGLDFANVSYPANINNGF